MRLMQLTKGQKVDVTKTNPAVTKLILGIGWTSPAEVDVDTSAFLLGVTGKVRQDEDFIFYSNPTDSNKAVIYSANGTVIAGHSDRQQIKVDLNKIPQDVDRIAITITIYEAKKLKQNFGQVSNLYIHLVDEVKGTELFFFDLSIGLSIENALVVGELYRNKDQWKFNATGSGFDGGLEALCRNFGIDTSGTETPMHVPVSQPKPSEQKPISLAKIDLTKKGQVINLQKKDGMLGEILVNLNWSQQKAAKSGFFSSASKNKGTDLDLGCLYELKSSAKGAVQALGNAFGSLKVAPFVSLDGDDRSGSVTTGENLRINGNHVSDIKRILVYAFIYEGVSNWKEADGVVTIKQTDGPDIIVNLDEYDNSKIMCAIALIENVDNQTFSIKRLVEFFKGHRQMAEAYNWGLTWKTGSKG